MQSIKANIELIYQLKRKFFPILQHLKRKFNLNSRSKYQFIEQNIQIELKVNTSKTQKIQNSIYYNKLIKKVKY